MSVFAGPGTRDYELLQPVGGGWTPAQRAQIQEGIETIRQMIFRAMQPIHSKSEFCVSVRIVCKPDPGGAIVTKQIHPDGSLTTIDKRIIFDTLLCR